MKEFVNVAAEVRHALQHNKPVVALESTIISHGMPYPQNVQTALQVEQIVRDKGCVPATVAVISGKLTVGCSREEIELLGKLGTSVAKVSHRDLPLVLAQGSHGATTVAATMYACKLAGIQIFATGGIGGVHRNAQQTMDISADLDELQHTPVTVVCAGAKSILDIGLTLECLETRGVPVIGFGTEDMPAFYTQKSGYKVDCRLDSAKEIASVIAAHNAIGMQNGTLVVNPIPQQYSMDADYIAQNIDMAVKEAEALGIGGKQLTPFLLDKIQRLTQGKSLQANIQLVFNNVRLACDIAAELCALSVQK